MPGKSEERTANRYLSSAFPLVLYVVGACAFFRAQIFSNFHLVFGGGADIRLVTFIHEHVYRALCGRAEFLLRRSSSIKQNARLQRCLLVELDHLRAVASARRRAAVGGLDDCNHFIAGLLLFLISVSAMFGVDVFVASVCALIFAFSNNLYLQLWHFQHFAVYYIPVVAYCGLLAVSETHRRPLRAYSLAAFAAALYGL